MLISSIGISQDLPPAEWKYLLHFGESGSRVLPGEFFLSETGHLDSHAELRKTLQLLQSSKGKRIACRFPARYQWLKKHYPDVPAFKLQECRGLNNFLLSFQKQTLSLMFASEYLDKPVSSFGHVMLVFHDRDKPVLAADTVHFVAQTDDNDGFVAYTWKGFTGGYPGHFLRVPFFEKQLQYNQIEQRYLHLYELDIDSQQIQSLLYHLYELRHAQFKYFFINENCAFQIDNLLNIAYGNTESSDTGFMLPVEVARNHKSRFRNNHVLFPISVELNTIINSLSHEDYEKFQDIIAGDILPSNELSNDVKFALASYNEFTKTSSDQNLKSHQEISRLKYTRPSLKISASDPLDRQDASRLGLSYINSDAGNITSLSYQPLLLDITDNQSAYHTESRLVLFSPVIHITDDKTYLEKFDIYSVRSMPVRNNLFKPMSWNFYTGFNRDNLKRSLNYETEFGLGLTNDLAGITLNYSLSLGIDVSTGDYYYKPALILLAGTGQHFKTGIEISEKYFENDKYINRLVFMTFTSGNHDVKLSYTSSFEEAYRRGQLEYGFHF